MHTINNSNNLLSKVGQNLSLKLRQARGSRKQREIQKALGFSQAVLSKMERGHREPTALELKRLADFYKKPLSFFFNEEPIIQTPLPQTQLLSPITPHTYPVPVTPELLQGITQNIVTHFQPQKIILFGSQAWGRTHRDSDIDFLVITNQLHLLRPAQRRWTIKSICQPPFVPMDLLVYTPSEIQKRIDAGDLFLKKILAKGKILYEKTSY